MSLSNIFDIASSGMTAETTRISASAQNMTNANVVVGNPAQAYQPKYPIFEAIQEEANRWMGDKTSPGVKVRGTYLSEAPPTMRYEPNNPVADGNGYVYAPNISAVEEMANMISASKSYQIDVNIFNMAKQLIQRTLQIGQ